MASHVYLVQRGTALYEGYEDKFLEVVGVYATLREANAAVRRCRREFAAEFGIEEEDGGGRGKGKGEEREGGWDEEESAGFCYEDRGSGSGSGEGRMGWGVVIGREEEEVDGRVCP